MKVTRMRLEDLEQVVLLAGQLGYPATFDELSERFTEIIKHPHHALFVASDAERVMGFIQVNKEQTYLVAEADARAEVSALVVDEASRGKKLGTLLLKEAEQWAKMKGLRLMRIRSNTKREAAHEFYKRRGYEIVKTWSLFVKKL